jgi:NAD(P)-dependent dehydrogenase (short-subunit alcohol dehydrogenase family)
VCAPRIDESRGSVLLFLVDMSLQLLVLVRSLSSVFVVLCFSIVKCSSTALFTCCALLLLLSKGSVQGIGSIDCKVHNSMGSSCHGRGKNVIIFGGSSGMGKACAKVIVANGGNVLLVSRSANKLTKAREEILSNCLPSNDKEDSIICQTAILDVTDEKAVVEFVNQLKGQKGQWDGLVYTIAGRAPHGSIVGLNTMDTRSIMESKLWGAYHCIKHILLNQLLTEGGAIVLTAGILNRRPGMNCLPLAIVNGALEGMTRALALELGPTLRVNCLSPGFCDTERFDHMDPYKKEAMMKNTAESLPLRRIGTPQDMGEALYYLLTAPFCTGVILDVDGGHGIRQYANPTGDPMRTKR